MFPKDCPSRKIGDRARQILHYQIDVDHWLFKEETSCDVGRDCILELSEDGQWCNHKVEGQIKGTKSPVFVENGEYVSFSLEVKTVNYALTSPISFVLFVADVVNEVVYFQCIQDYFRDNEDLLKKLRVQKSINIRIPIECTLKGNDNLLQELAMKIHQRPVLKLPKKNSSKEEKELVKC